MRGSDPFRTSAAAGGVPNHYLHPRVAPEGRVSAVSRLVIYRYGCSRRALRPKVDDSLSATPPPQGDAR